MSIGNLKNQGNKGNNFPYQFKSLQLLDQIATNTTGGGADYETRTTSYRAIANGTGYVINDIIVRYDIIDMPLGTIVLTLWFNQTDQTTIVAPLPGDLTPIASSSSVTVTNAGGVFAVNIQDGGNSITIDATSLPLPTGASTEATLLLALTQLTAINADLDVALSTRASEVTLSAMNTKFTSGTDIGDVTINNAAGAGAVNIQDGGNSITIDATSLPLPTGAATAALQTQPGVDIGDVTINNAAGAAAVNIQDGGNSITVDGTVAISGVVEVNLDASNDQVGTYGYVNGNSASPFPINVDASGVTAIQDNGGSITVDAVNLDIRDLAFATDKVDASGTTLGANSGVDIGDVTINNAAGAAAVNIQDGGNSITIDATSLPLPTGAATEATLGTVNTAVTGLNTPATGLAVAMFRSSLAVPAITAGKRSVAVFNAGNATGTVLGANLLAGESVSFSADGLRDTLAAIAYDATGTDFLITTVG